MTEQLKRMLLPREWQMGELKFTPETGWICPQCNAVMSPSWPTCFYCKPKIEEK